MQLLTQVSFEISTKCDLIASVIICVVETAMLTLETKDSQMSGIIYLGDLPNHIPLAQIDFFLTLISFSLTVHYSLYLVWFPV